MITYCIFCDKQVTMHRWNKNHRLGKRHIYNVFKFKLNINKDWKIMYARVEKTESHILEELEVNDES